MTMAAAAAAAVARWRWMVVGACRLGAAMTAAWTSRWTVSRHPSPAPSTHSVQPVHKRSQSRRAGQGPLQ